MDRKRWSGGLAVLALVGGLFLLSRADDSERKRVTVTVMEAPSCSLTCSPPNLRSTLALMTVSWSSNGNRVDFTGVPGGENDDLTAKPASGQHQHQYPYVPGTYTYQARCTRDLDGAVATSQCSSILSCFPAGTKIRLCERDDQGRWQPSDKEQVIERVKPGDVVLSYDVTNPGQPFSCAVVGQRIKTDSDKTYKIYTSSAPGSKPLEITPTHRLWVIRDGNGAWMDSTNVRVGDQLIDAEGNPVTVTQKDTIIGQIDVYNLITDYPNDFFANSILVHNVNKGAGDHRDHGFAGGTMVVKANGRAVPIESLKVGDRLMAVDPKTGGYVTTTVRRAFSQKVGETVSINGGKLRMGKKHPLMQLHALKRP